MRLSKMKLAGFKSFVDPTTIDFKSDRVAVVGPNGCGKSNVIDAVRWVLGESSAKQLRGDSMTDVIFNGSTARKPAGQASVELVFDNQDSSLGGEYAAYAEISIKRVVNREGDSQYFLNGSRCRRRDITHIFLGTGMNYSIIEQGMISRLIEAKPDELRQYLEETAGISKYKERRRETENRMKHTRENLERVNDLKQELEKQEEKLKRQSEAAAKFKVYSEEAKLLEAQHQAIYWRDLSAQADKTEAKLAQAKSQLEAELAKRVQLDTRLEALQIEHTQHTDQLSQAQTAFYSVNTRVTGIEQSLKHHKERAASLATQHGQILQQRAELQEEHAQELHYLQEAERKLAAALPEQETRSVAHQDASLQLNAAEAALKEWQSHANQLNQQWHSIAQKTHGAQTTAVHLEESIRKGQAQLTKLQSQWETLQNEPLEGQCEEAKKQVVERETLLETHKAAVEMQRTALQQAKTELQTQEQALQQQEKTIQGLQAEQMGLKAKQEAALGDVAPAAIAWLKTAGFEVSKRLGETLKVDSGYELALETVLGQNLESVCIPEMDSILDRAPELKSGWQFLEKANIDYANVKAHPDSLLARLQEAPADIADLLGSIFVVDSIQDAQARRHQLQAHESFVTRDGAWLGKNWFRMPKQAKSSDYSVLLCARRIEMIAQDLEQAQQKAQVMREGVAAKKNELFDLEMKREDLQKVLNEAHRLLAEAKAQYAILEKQAQQASARSRQLTQEIQEISAQIVKEDTQLKSVRATLSEDLDKMAQLTEQKKEWAALEKDRSDKQTSAKFAAKSAYEAYHALKIEISKLESSVESGRKNQVRLSQQIERLSQQSTQLHADKESLAQPMAQLESDLAQALVHSTEAETHLQAARQIAEKTANEMRELQQTRHPIEEGIQRAREVCESEQLVLQGIRVRIETLETQFAQTDFTLLETVANLPEEAQLASWEAQINQLRERIKRLGAINLAAIEEYEAVQERKIHLETQYNDLMAALTALEEAIAKIDKETRERFKMTFDAVNAHLRQLFPQIFSGGEAYLELTGESLLDAGVAIMARPPGKKNSTIHLLSGGEKALTAMALVFSLFRLNPSPFCMLDEVDAPLDDTNVGRFCNLVKEMAKSVQFIFITHNKITMEMGETMMGVTMKEPGVSRIVSVNVDEAAQMVEMVESA